MCGLEGERRLCSAMMPVDDFRIDWLNDNVCRSKSGMASKSDVDTKSFL
jgi:hypothetical protein